MLRDIDLNHLNFLDLNHIHSRLGFLWADPILKKFVNVTLSNAKQGISDLL